MRVGLIMQRLQRRQPFTNQRKVRIGKADERVDAVQQRLPRTLSLDPSPISVGDFVV